MTTLRVKVESQVDQKLLRAAVPNDLERQALEDADGENVDDLLEETPPHTFEKLIEAKDVGVLKALERKRAMELA